MSENTSVSPRPTPVIFLLGEDFVDGWFGTGFQSARATTDPEEVLAHLRAKGSSEGLRHSVTVVLSDKSTILCGLDDFETVMAEELAGDESEPEETVLSSDEFGLLGVGATNDLDGGQSAYLWFRKFRNRTVRQLRAELMARLMFPK